MIIGLAGPWQCGKDTAAQYLVEKYDFEHRKFAQKMRETVCALFDISDDYYEAFKFEGEIQLSVLNAGELPAFHNRITGRKFLERLGTEVGRKIFGQEFWVNLTLPATSPLISYATKKIVLSDVRFKEEAQRISKLGGFVIEIHRPGCDYIPGHPSSAGLRKQYIDYHVYNNADKDHLFNQLDAALDLFVTK